MKALSVTQPSANWICDGSKTIETRTWRTNYRGDILICATKQKVFEEGVLIEPLGVALCIVDIVDCRSMTKEDEKVARVEWRPELWAWIIENVRKIKPFPVKGQLRIFNIPKLNPCHWCGGEGETMPTQGDYLHPDKCNFCNGTGISSQQPKNEGERK